MVCLLSLLDFFFCFIQIFNTFWLFIFELLNLPKSHFRLEHLSICIYKIQRQECWKEFKFYHLIDEDLVQKNLTNYFPPPVHAHRISINNYFPDT